MEGLSPISAPPAVDHSTSRGQQVMEKVRRVAEAVKDFVIQHKAAVFFGASTLFVLAATPGALPALAVARTLAGGLASGIFVHLFSKLLWNTGFDSPRFGNTWMVVSGFAQLILWGFNPYAGVATAISNVGFHSTGLAVRAYSRLID